MSSPNKSHRSAVAKLAAAKRTYRIHGDGKPVPITLGIDNIIYYDEARDESGNMVSRYTRRGVVISYSDAIDSIKDRV